VAELTEAVRVISTVEAQLIAGMLRSNGIEALVATDDVGGLEPQLQLTGGVRVLVPTDELSAAQALIAEAQEGG
jgi:hypothetical protein